MKVLARFEYDRFEDMCSVNIYSADKQINRSVLEINHEINLKLYTLQFIMGILSLVYTNSSVRLNDKREQDKMFIKLFYEIIDRLECIEILDNIIDEILKTGHNGKELVYDEVLEYNLIRFFISTVNHNPYTTNLYRNIVEYSRYTDYTLKAYMSLHYTVYNKSYKIYNDIKWFKHKMDIQLSYSKIRNEFDKLLDNFCLNEYEDYMLHDIVQMLVIDGMEYRDEQLTGILFNNFIDKYRYVGKVYHGSRDLTGKNKDINYLVSKYRYGSISASKDIKIAMNFATHETYYTGDNTPILTYGFIAEIDLNENMIAIDLEKIMLDLKEKYPGLTDWVKPFLKEKEVLILAEYIQDAKILSYEEAEKIKESIKEVK